MFCDNKESLSVQNIWIKDYFLTNVKQLDYSNTKYESILEIRVDGDKYVECYVT